MRKNHALLLLMVLALASSAAPGQGAAPRPSTTRWACVHTRILLLLHPEMAAFDHVQGRFFRAMPTAQEEPTLLPRLQEAWNATLPQRQKYLESLDALNDQRLDLLLQRDRLVTGWRNEAGKDPSRQAEAERKVAAEEARLTPLLSRNEQQVRQVEQDLAQTEETALASIYLTTAETARRLAALRQEITTFVTQVAREEGFDVVVDSAVGLPGYPLDPGLPVLPHYPQPGNVLQISLFHWFTRWVPGLPPLVEGIGYDVARRRAEHLAAAFGASMAARFPGKAERPDQVRREVGRFRPGTLFLGGQTDLTAQVARRLLARYRIPPEAQTGYQLYLRDFLGLDRPLGMK